MSLQAGAHLGPYRIESQIGAGGMGEVYKATDTRLNRVVALKILPLSLADDPQLRERFDREARAISQLEHPHICPLYDVGKQGDVSFLVMQHLEGKTLEARLGRGALPLEDALSIGMQIADAIDHAHRAGVVHRDLKPANVMLTTAGVKLLDFGLAKFGRASATVEKLSAEVTQTTPITGQGTMLGTLSYMAPEQLEGRDADARSDIWALGCLLYEMATGERSFPGTSQASVIASILAREPEGLTNAQRLPAALAHVVSVCLAKDPERRWQSARDVLRELEWLAGGAAPVDIRADPHGSRRRLIRLAAAAVMALVATAAIAWYATRAAPLPPLHLDIATLPTTDAMSMALSPNGQHIAYVAESKTGPRLWVRTFTEPAARELNGTEEASYPFWSPDGRSIGFFAAGKLQRIDLAGGAPTVLADAPAGRGGTWSTAGVIVFAPSTNMPLMRIDANGGMSADVSRLVERQTNHRWPQFLPDGNRFLFSVAVNGEEVNGLYVGSLDGTVAPRLLPTTTAALFAPPDSLLYVAQGTLMARHFDPSNATVSGEPVVVAQNVGFDTALFRSAFTVSDTGVLAHRPAGPQRRQLTWFGRDGSKLGTAGPIDESAMTQPDLSVDDRRVVIQRNVDSNSDIWVVDVARSVTSRLTFTPQNETAPVWSPDGERILYRATSARGGTQTFEKAISGSAQRVLFATRERHTPNDWSGDGRFILFTVIDAKSYGDVWVLPTDDVGQAKPFLRTSFDEAAPRFSPNSRWVAYESNETGRYEIYVRPFPAGDAKWQLSNEGGRQPLWSRRGTELFYISLDNRIVSVSVTPSADGLTFGAPTPLFPVHMASGTNVVLTGGFQRAQYAVTGDGRFLVNLSVDNETPPIAVVLNWPATVQR